MYELNKCYTSYIKINIILQILIFLIITFFVLNYFSTFKSKKIIITDSVTMISYIVSLLFSLNIILKTSFTFHDILKMR